MRYIYKDRFLRYVSIKVTTKNGISSMPGSKQCSIGYITAISNECKERGLKKVLVVEQQLSAKEMLVAC